MGPIPHHMHQHAKHAALTGQEGKPECYYFPPQLNAAENHFDYTFMGLEPGTTKADVRRCLENWNQGDNGILDLSKAYRLKPGTGWLIPAGVLHAPGSMCTYEPQWGSDVFGMFQSLVEGREVPWDLLVKDVPEGQTPRPGLHRRAARLGEERRSPLQGAQLRGADRRLRALRRRLYRPLDRLRPLRRRATGLGQGTDRPARRQVRVEGPRGQRLDHGAGRRAHGPAGDARRP